MRRLVPLFLLSAFGSATMNAKLPDYSRALELYERTEYRDSLRALLPIAQKDAAALALTGQNYFMLGDDRKATESMEKALSIEPDNAIFAHWLGRIYARRAELGNALTALGYALKAGQMFEKSVALNPANKEAEGDLLDFYLEAPGFAGGGIDKAEKIAAQIARIDPAEGHYAQAQIEQKRKNFSSAEQHLRLARELAPTQVGRAMDLAMFLARRGRIGESEDLFETAARLAPDRPKILFERANTYIEQRRNLAQAKQLLERYIQARLTPNDPPRDKALALLKKIAA